MNCSYRPLVSVLMANYNNGDFISDAIESVKKQTVTDWELVIVDDGSSDNSVKLISEHLLNDKRIRLYKNDRNRGCGFTKRRCVEEAKGELLTFLDPDDIISPVALEKLAPYHKKFPDCAIVYSTLYVCNDRLDVIGKSKIAGPIPAGCSHAALPWSGPKISHLALFKHQHYAITKGIDSQLKRAVDQDLYHKLEEVGSCIFVDEPLYYYRHNSNSISLGKNHTNAKYWEYRVFQNTYKRRRIGTPRFVPLLHRADVDRKRLGYFTAKALQKAQEKEWCKMFYCLAHALPALYLDKKISIFRIALSPIKYFFRHPNCNA